MIESLAYVVECLTGCDPLLPSRRAEVVEGRILLVNALLMKGYTEMKAGEVIGWHRSTIHHHKQTLSDAQRYGTRPELIRKWNKLKELYDL